MRILVTGATGMLGRAVMRRFAAEKDFELTGLCHSRSGDGLVHADLTDDAACAALLERFAPDVVVHTAAIRKPDEFARDVESARRLNVQATATLASWAGTDSGRFLVYISTDYVFDGTTPPYRTDSQPHAINAYGVSKLDGEEAVRAAAEGRSAILRVPILYGDVESLQESSVTTVLAQVMKLARPDCQVFSKSYPLILDDWAVRYPTHVEEVADVLAQIVRGRFAGIFHWSGREALTKLDMGRVAAELLGVDASLLKGSGAPANGAEPRPKDCHLDCSALESIGVATRAIPFVEAIGRVIEQAKGA